MGTSMGDNTKIQAYNQINTFPDIKMMKLTLICMVASMVMLVAQAINVEEDADGLLKMEARAKDLFDSLEPVASYLLQAESRALWACGELPFCANCCCNKDGFAKAVCSRLEDQLAIDAEAEAEAEAIISTPLLNRVLF